MKVSSYCKRAAGAVLLILASGQFSAQARLFKDSQGREIDAELVARSGPDQVVILRAGKEFTAPISLFSVDDQLYIKQWIEENPDKVHVDSRFSYFVQFESGDRKTEVADQVYRDERLKRQDNICDMSISSQGDHPLENLRVEYKIFVEDYVDVRGNRFRRMSVANERASRRVERIPGSTEVELLQPKGRIDLKVPFETQAYVDRDGGKVAAVASDKVLGVWIRIYHGDKLIDEHQADQQGSMRDESWDEAATPGAAVPIR